MKSKETSPSYRWFNLMAMLAIFTLLAIFLKAAFERPASAQSTAAFTLAQYQPNFYKSDIAFPLQLTNGQGMTFPLAGTNTSIVTIRQGKGISLFLQLGSSNSTATTVTVGMDVTYNGTNGTTTHPLQVTFPANFINTNTYWTNWTSSVLDNIRTAQITFATNNTAGTIPGSNAVQLLKFTFSYSNQ